MVQLALCLAQGDADPLERHRMASDQGLRRSTQRFIRRGPREGLTKTNRPLILAWCCVPSTDRLIKYGTCPTRLLATKRNAWVWARAFSNDASQSVASSGEDSPIAVTKTAGSCQAGL